MNRYTHGRVDIRARIRAAAPRFSGLATGLGLCILIGCNELSSPRSQLASPQAKLTTTARATGKLPPLQAVNRFNLSLDASGRFEPGEPIRIDVNVRANLASPRSIVRVSIPELETLDRLPSGDEFRYQVNRPLSGALRRSVDFDVNDSESFSLSVQIPKPGYYRVVVTATADSSVIKSSGLSVRNFAVHESWLLIKAGSGGGHFAEFKSELIPRGYLRVPGPFRSARKTGSGGRTMELRDASMLEGSADFNAEPAPELLTPDLITYQVLYYDPVSDGYLPVPNAYYAIRTCTKAPEQFICEEEDFEQTASGYSDASGIFSFACDGDEYEGEGVTYIAAMGQVLGGVGPVEGDIDGDCGGDYQTVVPSSAGAIFKNLAPTYYGTMAVFGTARSYIDIERASSGGSFYSQGTDRITIQEADAFDEWGRFVLAHEYGHAFHNDILGGIVMLTSCVEPHFLDTENTLGCTFVEGFADYFGAVVRPDLGSYSPRSNFENDVYFPGCIARLSSPPYTCTGGVSTEGGVIEGAFAAFLYDLTDSTVEVHDSVAVPGTYVKQLVQSCTVQFPDPPSFAWRRANGADEIVYCAENAIASSPYFTRRGFYPIGYSESATESGGWSSARIQKMWRWNMYDKP